jgi:AraC-like DNA-binding protein
MAMRAATRRTYEELYRQATHLARRRYAEQKFGLREAATHCLVSPRQLQRIFRAVGNTTFGAYLEEIRMTEAAVAHRRPRAPRRPSRRLSTRIRIREGVPAVRRHQPVRSGRVGRTG